MQAAVANCCWQLGVCQQICSMRCMIGGYGGGRGLEVLVVNIITFFMLYQNDWFGVPFFSLFLVWLIGYFMVVKMVSLFRLFMFSETLL